MVTVNGEEYLTVKEATRLLGVKPATLYAYVSRGGLRSYRQGIRRQLPSPPAGRDGVVTSRLGRGNGVVPLSPRHPVAMAQAALTLSELSAGRFRLGIGVSHRVSMEASLGLTLREPLGVMREYVAVLRGALGGTVAFDGRHY